MCYLKEVLSNFNHKILEKQLRKVIVKSHALKRNYLLVTFKDFAKSLNNFDLEFFLKDCFRKPKLLLAANMLIYLNTSTNRYINNSRPLWPLGPHTFLHRIDTSGVKIRHALKKYIFFSQSRESEKVILRKSLYSLTNFAKRSIVDA